MSLQIMLEKMKERSIDSFMGRVLVKMVELQKTDDDARDVENEIFESYKTEAEKISKDFYYQSRKIGLKEFWKTQFDQYQDATMVEERSEGKDIRFTSDLIRQYM